MFSLRSNGPLPAFFILLFALPIHAQSLDWRDRKAVVTAALGKNTELISLASAADAAAERARVAGSRPNPMLMTGVVNKHIDLTNDPIMTMNMVGASQSLPRRERRDALKRSATLEAGRFEYERASLRAEIRRDVLFAWYDLAAADSQIRATKELLPVLENLVSASRIRYESGTTNQADVIRAQLQRSQVDYQLLTLQGRRRVAAFRLLIQCGLPLSETIPPLELSHGSGQEKISSAPVLADNHPSLAELSNLIAQREQEVNLAKLLATPDWNIEASYGMRPEDKDMFSLVARIELPIRRNSLIAPQIRAAVAERDATAQQVEVVRRRLQQDLANAWSRHLEATEQLKFYEEVLVPQTKLAFDSSLVAYQAGRDNFEAVIAAETSWLKLKIDELDLLALHIKSITDFKAIQDGARSGASSGDESTAMNLSGTGAKPTAAMGMN